MQQDDRVGAPAGDLAEVQRLHLLVGEPLAAVRADDQPVGPGAARGPAGVVLQRVDLVDALVEEEQQADQQGDHDEEHQQHPPDDPAATATAAGARGGPQVGRGVGAPAWCRLRHGAGARGMTWVRSESAGPGSPDPRDQPSGHWCDPVTRSSSPSPHRSAPAGASGRSTVPFDGTRAILASRLPDTAGVIRL